MAASACGQCSAYQQEVQSRDELLAEKERELLEFQTSSHELETALESELANAQKELELYRTRLAKLQDEMNRTRAEEHKYLNSTSAQITALQTQVAEMREANRKLLSTQRELEQRKDDAQRNERAQEFLVKDLSEKLEAALESNVLLQQDYESAEAQNRELIQRLSDELRDALNEIEVMQHNNARSQAQFTESTPLLHGRPQLSSKRGSTSGQAIYYEPTACCSCWLFVCFRRVNPAVPNSAARRLSHVHRPTAASISLAPLPLKTDVPPNSLEPSRTSAGLPEPIRGSYSAPHPSVSASEHSILQNVALFPRSSSPAVTIGSASSIRSSPRLAPPLSTSPLSKTQPLLPLFGGKSKDSEDLPSSAARPKSATVDRASSSSSHRSLPARPPVVNPQERRSSSADDLSLPLLSGDDIVGDFQDDDDDA